MNLDMNFFYWVSGVLATVIFSYVTFKYMNKIKNVRIDQKGEKMTDVTGVDLKLNDGENIHIKNMVISQDAKLMQNVTGLKIEANGKQSARLQGVTIEQPNKKVIISDDTNVSVIINKQD